MGDRFPQEFKTTRGHVQPHAPRRLPTPRRPLPTVLQLWSELRNLAPIRQQTDPAELCEISRRKVIVGGTSIPLK